LACQKEKITYGLVPFGMGLRPLSLVVSRLGESYKGSEEKEFLLAKEMLC